jgi:5-methylcytosine-specific restriction endonuclease McrA
VSKQCYICGVTLTKKIRTRDHVIPRSLLKHRDVHERRSWNLRPCCGPCNIEKGSKITEEAYRLAEEHGIVIDRKGIS